MTFKAFPLAAWVVEAAVDSKKKGVQAGAEGSPIMIPAGCYICQS